MARTTSKTQTPAPAPLVNEVALERIESAAGELVVLQDAIDLKSRALAAELRYEGSLTIGSIEDEIRFYQRRTVEACLELGKRLLLLKQIAPHGTFTDRVVMLGLAESSAHRFMQAAAKTAKSPNLGVLSTQVKSLSAFLELVTHDDDVLENLKDLDNVDRMSASQLRSALRQSVREGCRIRSRKASKIRVPRRYRREEAGRQPPHRGPA